MDHSQADRKSQRFEDKYDGLLLSDGSVINRFLSLVQLFENEVCGISSGRVPDVDLKFLRAIEFEDVFSKDLSSFKKWVLNSLTLEVDRELEFYEDFPEEENINGVGFMLNDKTANGVTVAYIGFSSDYDIVDPYEGYFAFLATSPDYTCQFFNIVDHENVEKVFKELGDMLSNFLAYKLKYFYLVSLIRALCEDNSVRKELLGSKPRFVVMGVEEAFLIGGISGNGFTRRLSDQKESDFKII